MCASLFFFFFLFLFLLPVKLQRDLKEWAEKHKDLNEKIKVFQKSQKELEDALAHKENEIDVRGLLLNVKPKQVLSVASGVILGLA